MNMPSGAVPEPPDPDYDVVDDDEHPLLTGYSNIMCFDIETIPHEKVTSQLIWPFDPDEDVERLCLT